jgi:SAM-dependent methyltransferase
LCENGLSNEINNLSFESLMHNIYLDYKDKKEINIYKKRIIESYLKSISFNNIINNNISPNPHITYVLRKNNGTLEFTFNFSIEARKLIEFCEVALTSDVLYQKATYMLYDLFGFRRDSYDRFYNELNYLNTMNSGKNEKSIILDYIVGRKVLDVGPGGGVLLDLIENKNKDYDIWGIDLSQNVIDKLNEKKSSENHKWNIVKGDALNLTKYFKKEDMDTIIYSSIIHELYSYISYDGKKFNKETIKKSLQEAYEILKVGGRIIIRDGIMTSPKTDYRLIEFKNIDDINILNRYCNDFKGRKVTYEVINENTVKMLVNDAMEFLYTYTWGEQSYPLEVQEQFGYFTLNEYIDFIKENLKNSKIIEAKSFLQEGYEKNLLNRISIFDENRNVVKLPDSTSLIVIEKR